MTPWRESALPLCARENVRVWYYSPTWYQQAREADRQTWRRLAEKTQATYLVDAADPETESAAFHTRSIHKIPNK
jgi:hypothetical protein